MLVWIINYLLKFNDGFFIFSGLFFRIIVSFFISLIFSFLIGPRFILWFRKMGIVQIVRDSGPISHFIKRGVPTMGGIVIITSIILSTLLCSCLHNLYVWYVLFILFSYGIIGFVDDYYKLVQKNSLGIGVLWKYFWQSSIVLILIVVMFAFDSTLIDTRLVIPFFKEFMPRLGITGYVLFVYLVVVGTSNAVNLTDGLDGLVTMPIIFVSIGIGLLAMISSDINLANYLNIPYVQHAAELVVICAAIIGANLGFLWFNFYPAQIFMGDTGSLSLGGVLGLMSVILCQEFLLFVMGGVFVIETMSVILQVVSFKLWGKRIFLMSPVHHHFELQGIPESRIVVRFWIISFILFLLGLISLQVR